MSSHIPLAQIDPGSNLKGALCQPSAQRQAPQAPSRVNGSQREAHSAPFAQRTLELANNLRLLLKAHFAPSGTVCQAVAECLNV